MSKQSSKLRYKLQTIHEVEHIENNNYQDLQPYDKDSNLCKIKNYKQSLKLENDSKFNNNCKSIHKCQILQEGDQIQRIHQNLNCPRERYSSNQRKSMELRNLSSHMKKRKIVNYSMDKLRYNLTSCSQNRLNNNHLNIKINVKNSNKDTKSTTELKRKKLFENTNQQKQNIRNEPWKFSTEVRISQKEELFSGEKNLLEKEEQLVGRRNTCKDRLIEKICQYLEDNRYKKGVRGHKFHDPRKKKNKQGWFSQFISEKNIPSKQKNKINPKQINNNEDLQDSLEYIDKQTPAPNHYKPQQILDKSRKSQERCTFGSASRFQKSRPITADVEYIGIKNSQSQNNQEYIDHVSFGTSKNNLRSQIKKIEYCDWSRPHYYGQVPNLAEKNGDENAIFKSNQQRLKNPELKYKGPDYYVRQIKSHQQVQRGLPSHYFLSEVSKGYQFPPEDQRDFIPFQTNKENNKGRRQRLSKKKLSKLKEYFEQNKQNYQIDLNQEIPEETPKNSLGNKKRKVNFQKLSKTKSNIKSKTKNKQLNSTNIQKDVQDSFEFPQKLKLKARQYTANTWITPSFNIKFQSKNSFF